MLSDHMIERRLKPRICISFPVVMRGIDESGEKYEVQGSLANISASGLYVCTEKLFRVGEQVFLAVQLSRSRLEEGARTNCLATLGNVVRVDYTSSHTYGVAVRFDSYKFI